MRIRIFHTCRNKDVNQLLGNGAGDKSLFPRLNIKPFLYIAILRWLCNQVSVYHKLVSAMRFMFDSCDVMCWQIVDWSLGLATNNKTSKLYC